MHLTGIRIKHLLIKLNKMDKESVDSFVLKEILNIIYNQDIKLEETYFRIEELMMAYERHKGLDSLKENKSAE